jgi:hypothetical protein
MRAIIDLVSVVAPTLAKLEAELDAALREHHDSILRQLARILVAMAVEEHHGDARRAADKPRLCAACGSRLAAPQRSICHSCRGKQRRQRDKLRRAFDVEVAAARNGSRGERAQQIAVGERRTSML